MIQMRHVTIGIIFSFVGLLDILNDADMLLRQILIGCSSLSQEYCKLIGWY